MSIHILGWNTGIFSLPYTHLANIYFCCLCLKVLGALDKVFSPVLLELIFCILGRGIGIVIESDQSNCPL